MPIAPAGAALMPYRHRWAAHKAESRLRTLLPLGKRNRFWKMISAWKNVGGGRYSQAIRPDGLDGREHRTARDSPAHAAAAALFHTVTTIFWNALERPNPRPRPQAQPLAVWRCRAS